ncbi:MAG: alpha/beta hydrolase [Hyphomicrobiaceae bacterium]|nr:alpha/beta hydrolase [Hyphomicrobiaceae bacterium]
MADQMAERNASSAFLERKLEADGFTIRYLEAGPQSGGAHALICMHGAGGLRLSRMHEILARTWRVIAFETPGFGTSKANERSRDMAELAGSLCAAVAALGITAYNLMGTSFGGKLATYMALQEGEKLQSLILISPAVFRPAERPPMATPEDRHKLMHAHPERFPVTLSNPEVDSKQETLVRRLIGPPRDPALEEKLPGLSVPTLVVFGTEDRLTPPEMARCYRQHYGNAHLMLIYDAAHRVDLDRPEAVAEVVGDFLARKERFLVSEQSGVIHP